jgi:hypothetical protein
MRHIMLSDDGGECREATTLRIKVLETSNQIRPEILAYIFTFVRR